MYIYIYIYSIPIFGDVKPKHELTSQLGSWFIPVVVYYSIPIAEESLIICKHSARASHGVLSSTMEDAGLFSGEVCQLLEDIWLVVSNICYFPIIYGIILPID